MIAYATEECPRWSAMLFHAPRLLSTEGLVGVIPLFQQLQWLLAQRGSKQPPFKLPSFAAWQNGVDMTNVNSE